VIEPRCQNQTSEDEIDLIELIQDLWEQRWLIAAVTSLVLMFSVVYVFVSKPIYSVTAVLAPAPVNAFGLIAGDMGVEQLKVAKSVISIGTDLADDAFALVVKNFESTAVLDGFNNALINADVYTLQVIKGRSPVESVSISVFSDSSEGAKEYLDGYMAYVSEISATQLNEYFQALSLSHAISPGSLYRIEQLPKLPAQPIKPKKPLIIFLGVVLGGMLGVFSALMRLVLRKRSAKMT
jgi:LPS O-antigen subunit length determinant protein (WzzB/FepE family)